MTDIHFAFPMVQAPIWIGAGVGVVLIFMLLLKRLERRREIRVHRFVTAALAPRLLAGYDARHRRPLYWFAVIGLVFLLIALAQPRWGKAWGGVARSGRDILILMDTSESMNATDPLPTRISRARQKVDALLDRCPADRFGLIAFSGGAVLQCPLTEDHAYFRSILEVTDTNVLEDEGTDIAAAFHEALETFKEDIEDTGQDNRESRTILLISDGEAVTGDQIAAAEAVAPHTRIHVLGIGSPEGAPVTFQAPDQARRGWNNEVHHSKLDEENLKTIAQIGGGVYLRTSPNNADVDRLKAEFDALRSQTVSGDMRYTYVNRYRWPLSIAILCFAAEGLWLALLPGLRRRAMRRAAQEDPAHA